MTCRTMSLETSTEQWFSVWFVYVSNWTRFIAQMTECNAMKKKNNLVKIRFSLFMWGIWFNCRTTECQSVIENLLLGMIWQKLIFFFFFCFNLFSVPNGSHPFRTLGIGQRPFLEAPFTSHLRDLDFRRKAPPLTAITTSINNTPGGHPLSNGLSSSDCQGYKPNAPQIQGKKITI